MTACVKCGHNPEARVVASWMFIIERDPPTLNDRLVNAGPGAHVYRKVREAWGWEVRAARLANRIPKAKARRRITLTRLYSGQQKIRDFDNLAGGMKMIVDALVSEGMLVGDDPASVEVNYQQERFAGRGLRVHIEELADHMTRPNA